MIPSGKFKRALIYCLPAAVCCLMTLVSSERTFAQQLPLRFYNVADGLPASWVKSIYQDSKGYIWISTGIGLSRFDGYGFRNYGARQELRGQAFFSEIAEDQQGRIWVGTAGSGGNTGIGVARLIDDPGLSSNYKQDGSHAFSIHQISSIPDSNSVYGIAIDRDNSLWAVTRAGLYRAQLDERAEPVFQIVLQARCHTAFLDGNQNFWIAVDQELMRISPNGTIHHSWKGSPTDQPIVSMAEDSRGRLFAANAQQLLELVALDTEHGDMWQRVPLTLRPGQQIKTMSATAEREVVIGTSQGLFRLKSDEDKFIGDHPALSEYSISAMVADREGNTWIGTEGGGLGKLSVETLVTYTQADGLPTKQVGDVFEDRYGHLYTRGLPGGIAEINGRSAATQIVASEPNHFSGPGTILQDSRTNWWIGTDKALLATRELKFGKLIAPEGVPEAGVRVIYEDSSGSVWVSLEPNYLFKFTEAGNWHPISQHEALAAASFNTGVIKMLDDGKGNLWLCSHSQLARWSNNKITVLGTTEGLPEMRPRSLFRDSRGWIWIGLRTNGVSVTADPGAEHPHFINYSTATGLSDDSVWSITEDNFGRIYLATEKGVNQLDPATGLVHHITSKDGLPGDLVYTCFKDRSGHIWVATNGGASKYTPVSQETSQTPPPIYIDTLHVAGRELALSRGSRRLPQLSLNPAENNLRIEFVGISYLGDQSLRYQYKLEGVDGGWSRPSRDRSVNYAKLAPGSYRFMVQAINRDGLTSLEPALLEFRVLPPIWRRSWFLALLLVTLGVASFLLYRYRVSRLIELERVRTRLATDLHDDIGSGLSQIAILSEVAKGQISRSDSNVTEALSSIATTSRELVDSMSDIVWAVDPEKDHLSNLTQRMRAFASETLAARDIVFKFREPDVSQERKLGVEVRRQVFLIFKEAINNIANHSACSTVEIEFAITDGWLSLELSDDGKGFDVPLGHDGHGLKSMSRRAEEIGGVLELISNAGHGTTVTLRAPFSGRSPAPRSLDSPT